MSLGSEPATVVVKESYTAQTIARVIIAVNIAPITFLQVSLRSPCVDLQFSGSLEAIRNSTRHPNILGSSSRVPRADSLLHAYPCARSTLVDVYPR